MTEYIKRELVLQRYDEVQREGGVWRFESLINSIPAEDVKPVRHGKWVYDDVSGEWGFPYLCTSCGKAHNFEEEYCPNCGAKMDLEG